MKAQVGLSLWPRSLLSFLLIAAPVAAGDPAGAVEREEIATAGPTSRSGGEIPDKYKWDLTDLYKTADLWEEDFKALESMVEGYDKYRGNLGKSAQTLLEASDFDELVGARLTRVSSYASLSSDLNTKNQENQQKVERVTELRSKLAKASAFYQPEIQAIPAETLAKFNAELPGLKYAQALDNTLRMKPHTLSPELEELLAQAMPVVEAPERIFGIFKDADLKYPSVLDPAGEKFDISEGGYYQTIYSLDRSFRERVYKGFYEPFIAYQNTFGALYNSNLQALIFNRKARHYNSALHAALDRNNIPVSVYDNLITTINQNLGPFQRWAQLKKKVLNVTELHPYDTYVTLFPGTEKQYTYDEGVQLVMAALQPLGQGYLDQLRHAFDHRWVDVYETPGKKTGAYSSGPILGEGGHPYVLLNWKDTRSDVFTLAHEMGHNMHSFFSAKTQPPVYADYAIFVAEVASTANEALLLDYLIQKAETKEQKMALIEEELKNIQTTFYRQTRFAEFEKIVAARMEAGAPMTPKELTDLFGSLYKHYWGDAMVMDPEEAYSWSRIPHFYYNFYVFQYATSYAATLALVEGIKKEGQPAMDRYLKFLNSGSSKYPLEILKVAGVDMSTPQPIQAVANRMTELLDQLEALINQK